MSDFTFLTKEQCTGEDCLDIFKKRGTESAATDFYILLGGFLGDVKEDSTLSGRIGCYWTKTDDGARDAYAVTVLFMLLMHEKLVLA